MLDLENKSTDSQLICQGAEGKVYSTTFLGRPAICKERLRKKYRVAVLDEKITRQRLVHEARCIAKCHRLGVPTPCVYTIDLPNNCLYMEKIIGSTLKSYLWDIAKTHPDYSTSSCDDLARRIGAAIGLLHDAEVVHGDLTTSNIMIRDSLLQSFSSNSESSSSSTTNDKNSAAGVHLTNNKNAAIDNGIVLIDFGLGLMKPSIEDKAVDLYVLERAFISTHPNSEKLIERILEAYRFTSKKGTTVLLKLDQVRTRGRKRDMIG